MPKFRQSVSAIGVAPTVETLRHASATAIIPPTYGIEVALSAVAVGREGYSCARAPDAQDGGVPAGSDDGVGLDLVVVLAVNGQLGGDVRAKRAG